MSRTSLCFLLLGLLTLALLVADLFVGSVRLPASDVVAAFTGGDCPAESRYIVLNIRLLKAITALFAGAALSASGLQMQTLFRNPLAGPYVLGVSSGASLGVALFLLGAPLLGVANHSLVQSLGLTGAAWLGSALVLLAVMAVGRRIKDIMVILILGMMFGSGIGSVVEILQYLSNEAALKSFVIWTMGSLGDVTASQLGLLLPPVIVGLLLSVASIKPLNMLRLGENYARTMGLNIVRVRTMLILSTVLLAGTVTANCGTVGFIGLALPPLARLLIAAAVGLARCLRGAGVETEKPAKTGTQGATNEARIAFLESYGWQVEPEPVKTQQVTVPAAPSEVFLRYNELQISQGYDLLQYSGKELTRYVYRITNYPDESGVYYATLLVKDGQVVGADVASSAKTGVMHGLKMPE